jgi:hypothetical protein
MKITRGRILVAAAIGLVSAATVLQASEAMKAIVGSYLEIQAQLATDKIDGIKAPAAAIASRAEALGDGGAAIAKAAKAVGDAADVKVAREAFAGLSDAVIAAAKAEGWKDLGDTKLAFCPMVKRSWLQKDEKIRNPYFGSTMLECGEFKKP